MYYKSQKKETKSENQFQILHIINKIVLFRIWKAYRYFKTQASIALNNATYSNSYW